MTVSEYSEYNDLAQQIYTQMDKKETEELLEIWHKHDPEAWTDEAFEAAHDILLKRLGAIPEQKIVAADDEDETEEADDAVDQLLRIAGWAEMLAWPILGISVLVFVIRLVTELEQLSQNSLGFSGQNYVFSFLFGVFSSFYSLLIGAFYFVVLMAVSKGIDFFIDTDED